MKNRYRLLEMKGEGSFGVVYRAFDKEQCRDVAIKFLKNPSAEDRAQLEHEASLLDKLNHKFIVHLLDSDINASEPYIVVEYCDKGSLRKHVGTLSWQRVVHILAQVAEGLQAIHDSGGFHRDLKPENLLVKTEKTGLVMKIADFGVARIPGTGSLMTHGPRGTRGYIASEVLEGHPFNATSDVYALGIVATELLTGSRNLNSLDSTDVPPWLRSVLRAMRSLNPEHRPTSHQCSRLLLKNAQNVRSRATASALEIS